ncbi:lytic transglycosylase domain-containing protein [Enterobacter ludwigii]|uniref:lytic transglycosylase domain-containing protein n=1 Tax=Enterobacter ludwigii TaxID=299767 RepID=UPI0018B04D47|nr:lytic transglycosylase domain-containing protein [Enterobacter ludwigii]
MGKNVDGATDSLEGVGEAANTAGDDLEGAGKKATEAGKDFKGAGESADDAGEAFETSGKKAETAGKRVSGAGKKGRKAKDDTNSLGKSLKKAGKDAAKFGKVTASSFNKVTKYALGFFGVALTLEGARRFFTGMTTDILALSNAASFMDMPIKQMDGFHKAAEAAGSSAAVVDGVLMKMQNAVNWKNMPMGAPDASTMALMRLDAMTGNRFKIMAQKNARTMTLAMAHALRSMPKVQAEQFAGMLGIDSGMFADIRSGAFEKNQSEFSKKSGQSDENAKRAREIKKTLVELQTTAESVGNAIYNAFGDDVNELLKKFDGELEKFGDYIIAHHDDIIGFFKEGSKVARDFSDALGGTSNAFIVLAAAYLAAKRGGIMGPLGLVVAAGGLSASGRINDLREQANKDHKNVGQETYDKIHAQKKPFDIMGFLERHLGSTGKAATTSSPQPPFARDDIYSGVSLNGILSVPKSTLESSMGTLDVPQHAQAARRRRKNKGVLLSPLLANHNTMLESKYGLPPGSLSALAMAESSGNPYAISKAGALGAYQIMPKTGTAYGMKSSDFFNPLAEADVAAKILSENLRHYQGNLQLALAAYNGGMGRVDKALNGRGMLPEETLNYPERVMSYMDETSNYYANAGAATSPGAIDNSQTSATHINTVNVGSHPLTVDELTQSILEQSRRSGLTGSFLTGTS